jgi:accessory gene regulator B
MKKLAHHLAVKLKENTGHPASLAVIQFGIEGFLNTLVTTIVLTAASVLLGQGITVFFIVLGFSCLRMFTGGAHLKSSLGCTLVSVSILVGSSYLPLTLRTSLFLCAIAFTLIEVYSYYIEPYQSTRPLKHKDKFKLLAQIWIIFGFFLSFFEVSRPFATGLFLQALSVTPYGIRFIHALNHLFLKGGETA